MTLRELIDAAGRHPAIVALAFSAPPLLVLALGYAHRRGGGAKAPWRYVYAVVIYLVCVPGILAALLTAYALFFTGENLLDVDLLVYFAPLASMILTLVLVRRNVAFDAVPGFDRLSGLIVLIAASFAIAFALQRLRIWVLFGGSLAALLGLALVLFLLLKWGASMLLKRRAPPGL